jgi:hypothetical protein
MILYGPNAIIKLRRQTPDTSQILPSLGDRTGKLYQGRMKVTEQLQTTEGAIIESLGNDSLTGVIPPHNRQQASAKALASTSAFDLRIRDAALETRNYDKRLDRFIRKFDPDEEMKAIRALYRGHYSDVGW